MAASFPQVRPYGAGPRARFPYGIRRDQVSGTLEDQLRASVALAERESLRVEITRLANRVAAFASQHPEAGQASELIDAARAALAAA